MRFEPMLLPTKQLETRHTGTGIFQKMGRPYFSKKRPSLQTFYAELLMLHFLEVNP